jgi:hypothetical protein
MTLAVAPAEASEATGSVPVFNCPPSLLRRNPARIDLSDERGEFPSAGPAGLNLRSGTHYKVQVWLQRCEESGPVGHCQVQPGFALRSVFSPREVSAANGDCYVFIEPRNLKPLPIKTELRVFLHQDGWGAHSLPLSVVVWPSLGSRFCWVLGVALALLAVRFNSLWQDKGGSAVVAIRQIATDALLWAEIAGLVVVLMLALSAIGLLWAAYGPRSG